MRVRVTLASEECKQRNYNTMKNKKNDPDRLSLKNIVDFVGNIHFIKQNNLAEPPIHYE